MVLNGLELSYKVIMEEIISSESGVVDVWTKKKGKAFSLVFGNTRKKKTFFTFPLEKEKYDSLILDIKKNISVFSGIKIPCKTINNTFGYIFELSPLSVYVGSTSSGVEFISSAPALCNTENIKIQEKVVGNEK